jgi:hypothetical protein
MKINKKVLVLIVGVPLIIWIIGFCLDYFKVTGDLTTPLTRDVLDFWFIAAICFLIYWLFKRKKQVK